MAIVCFTASAGEAFHGHWALAGREFLGVPFCITAIWLGLKMLTGLNQFFDWVFKGVDEKSAVSRRGEVHV